MTDPTCTVCRVACAVGLTVTFKTLKGAWDQHRYCRTCAVWLGECQDERARAADELAERTGV